ncbi:MULTISPECIES: DUF4268 domain-containing protein [Methanobacterium]|uniref:DUF4268 domain-containing protein n=1 Tax=Methanobacterium veterum TaxID=408577 RepID=A0A9E5A2Y2_9EURY|nr:MULTISPECIES: DUF4268 domain-containing protein [Methanobacterium]MCZ3367258.1 DUF4268 domain-containing protein [Methanobacterium veterum]MCZ3373594.1 DUF4268 domain-containing protein [Methanobacterium veterum]
MERQQGYPEFWEMLIEKFNVEMPEAKISKTRDKHYLQILTGINGIHFEWFLAGKPLDGFLVALHFELKDNYYENRRLLDCFESRKEEFENIFEEKLQFGGHSNSTHMFLKKETDNMDDVTLDWGVKTMIKFYDTLKPILDEELNKYIKI